MNKDEREELRKLCSEDAVPVAIKEALPKLLDYVSELESKIQSWDTADVTIPDSVPEVEVPAALPAAEAEAETKPE